MGVGLPRGLFLYWLTFARGVRSAVPLLPEVIGRARLADPQTDLERPFAEPTGSVAPALRGRLPLVAFRFCFVALLGAVPVRIAALRLHPAVVAPTDEDLQRVDSRAHEEAQPHGRGEEALLRGPAVFGGVVAEPRPFRLLGLVVHVRVAALLYRRATGDEKSGEVPVGRPLPAPQSLVRQRMAGPRANEVESERVGERLANFGGFRQTSHVTCRRRSIAATVLSPTAVAAIRSTLSASGKWCG